MHNEIIRIANNESIDESTHDEIKQVVNDLVVILDEATDIVYFFNKQDEINYVNKKIKRQIIETKFYDAK